MKSQHAALAALSPQLLLQPPGAIGHQQRSWAVLRHVQPAAPAAVPIDRSQASPGRRLKKLPKRPRTPGVSLHRHHTMRPSSRLSFHPGQKQAAPMPHPAPPSRWPRQCGAPFLLEVRRYAVLPAPYQLLPRNSSLPAPIFVEPFFVEPFAQPRSSSREQRSNSRFASPHNLRHLRRPQFLDCSKQKNIPLRLRQSLHFAQNCLHALRFIERHIGRNTCRHQTLRKHRIHLLRPYAPPAIESEIPRNPHQPHTHIAHLRQSATMLKQAHKNILHNVLGLRWTPQNRVSYAE